jgi:hypothetical protein
MKWLFFSRSATLVFKVETGMSAHLCPAAPAFRIRVSISAIGSVIMVEFDPLPACFPDARNFALKRLLSETNPAESEFSDEPARTSAPVAAITMPARKLGLAIISFDQSFPGHRLSLSVLVGVLP